MLANIFRKIDNLFSWNGIAHKYNDTEISEDAFIRNIMTVKLICYINIG